MITSARSRKILSKTILTSPGSMQWYRSGKKRWRWFWMLSLVRCSHVGDESCLPNDVVDEDSAKIPDVSIVEASAELLYGLVHQRYVLTRAGLHAMVSEPPWLTAVDVFMIPNAFRRKSTKLVFLARVHAYIAWAATLSLVGDPTYQDWRR
jgi:hypothetical protein